MVLQIVSTRLGVDSELSNSKPRQGLLSRVSDITSGVRALGSMLLPCARSGDGLKRTVPGLLRLLGLSDAYSGEGSDEDEAWPALRLDLQFLRRRSVWRSSVVPRGVPHPVASSSCSLLNCFVGPFRSPSDVLP